MKGRRRNTYQPSSSAKLATYVLSIGSPSPSPEHIKGILERNRERVEQLAGPFATPEWAIAQLTAPPHVAKGWPNPCKAARVKMPVPKQEAAR